jgi:hypothetical protein
MDEVGGLKPAPHTPRWQADVKSASLASVRLRA